MDSGRAPMGICLISARDTGRASRVAGLDGSGLLSASLAVYQAVGDPSANYYLPQAADQRRRSNCNFFAPELGSDDRMRLSSAAKQHRVGEVRVDRGRSRRAVK